LARDSHLLRAMTKGAARIAIESIHPQVDCGRFPIKRTLGEVLRVEADVFTDSHDALGCRLLYKGAREKDYLGTPMTLLGNDRWAAEIVPSQLGRFVYSIEAWIDPFTTWLERAMRLERAQLSTESERPIGIDLLQTTREICIEPNDRAIIGDALERLRHEGRRIGEVFRNGTMAASASTSRCGSIRSARASPPGTSSSRARARASQVVTAPSRTSSRSFRGSRRWASTSSISRRSIRSDAR
jgi:hypothetical protein